MVWLRRTRNIGLASFAIISIVAVVVVLVLTQTDFGRRRVLAFGLDQLARRVNGSVRVGRIHGNLLTGARLVDVVITDSAGRPFLKTDTLELRYSLRSIVRQRLMLSDVRIVNGVVVLDQPPGEEWNFKRIFPSRPARPGAAPGFGSWVSITNLSVHNVAFVVRSEWAPDAALQGAARRSAVDEALSPASRKWIVPVGNGYQSISQFFDVNGRFPLLRVADPDSANRVIRIATLSMIALPFRPPLVRVQNMSGLVVITKDSVLVDSMRVRLPGTRASGVGAYALDGGAARIQLTLPEASFADARFIRPDAPEGRGSLRLALTMRGERTHLIASDMNLRVEGATVRGLADLTFGSDQPLLFGPSDVTYANVDTRLVQRYVPSAPLDRRGMLSGHMRLNGTPNDLTVDGWTNYDETNGPTSRIVADGRIGTRNGDFVARGLRLDFEPVYMSLLRGQLNDVPYEGAITGTTTLSGSAQAGFAVVADVTHDSRPTGRSHVTANGRITIRDGVAANGLRLGLRPLQVAALRPFMTTLPIDGVLVGQTTVTGSPSRKRISSTVDVEHHGSTGTSHFVGRANANWAGRGAVDVNVRVPVLSMATVGKFAPGAGLHGSASGNIIARGPLANLNADLDLAIAGDNGAIRTRGVFDLLAANKRYDFSSTFTDFDASAVVTHAPETRLTGTVVARGVGTSAATANARIDANLIGSRAAGGPVVDTLIVQAILADGLANIERGHARLASARGDVSGTFGLVMNRTGSLRYDIAIDTLTDFVELATRDTSFVPARPLAQARIMERARADSARTAQRTEVQRAAVGYPPPPELHADTLPARRDTVTGQVRAQGTLTGNIERFDARGTAEARNFTYGANYIGLARANYTLTGFRTPDASLHVEAAADTLHVQGFAFDSSRLKLDYTGVRNQGRGTVEIGMFQDSLRDYRLHSDFNIALESKQLALRTLILRFDTTRWESTHPATIAWGKPGTRVGNLELRNNAGGRIQVDGILPTDGVADLRLDIEKLQLGDITTLVQDTGGLKGLFDLHARVQGATSAPAISGNLALVESTYRGTSLPDVRGTLSYANQNLSAHTEFFRAEKRLAVADARLPVNLAFTNVKGPRINRNAPLQVDAIADSLPLEALPSFTTAVSDVRGRLRGNWSVRGTFNQPSLEGIALLDLGSLRVNATGVRYNAITGTIRLRGDTAFIDSIVAYNGGPIRTTGKLALETLMQPGFDLSIVADDAWLLDNEKGRVRADADVTVKGPYTGVVVSGTANVRGGVFYAPETRNQRVTNLDDPMLRTRLDTVGLGLAFLPKPNPLLQNMQVDVSVRIQPDTWARNSQFNVEVFTPPDEDPLHIRMDRANQVLTLTGVIHADHGEYAVAGRSLQLSTGSATFLGGPTLDPLIELTARYQVQRKGVEALIIEVHVDGNLSHPRVTLQSNAQPPLPQSEMLAYLAFGQPTSSLLNAQSSGFGVGEGGLTGIPALAQQQLASVAVGATVDQMVADIEKQGTRRGLDVLRVHAGELPPEAAFEGYFQNVVRGTEIEAGKYVADRLYVEARGRISTYPGLSVEYRNPIGLTWRGTWEARYRPVTPSLSADQVAEQVRSIGVFMLYNKRF